MSGQVSLGHLGAREVALSAFGVIAAKPTIVSYLGVVVGVEYDYIS
ncbi:hypothetical protein [Allocoleopsis sp.]